MVTASRCRHAWNVARANSLLMVGGAVVALAWANRDPAGYERYTHPLHFAVNDVAMAFFFGLAMKEIIEAAAGRFPVPPTSPSATWLRAWSFPRRAPRFPFCSCWRSPTTRVG